MAETLQYVIAAELREASEGPTLRGVVLQEGRAAQGGRKRNIRAACFGCLAVEWYRSLGRTSRSGARPRRPYSWPRWFTPNRDPGNPGDPRSLRDPQVLLC